MIWQAAMISYIIPKRLNESFLTRVIIGYKISNYFINLTAIEKKSNKNIIIASVNRTQDDHRLYEKWGKYFQTSTGNNVHLFGKAPCETENVEEFSSTNSLKYGRLLSPFFFLVTLFKTKPDLIVCITFELLLTCGIYKLLSGKKTLITYDVIENYTLNLWHQKNHNFIIKLLFYPHIKLREWLSILFVNHYFYSDEVYLKQLKFIRKKKHSFLPNYYSGSLKQEKPKKTDHLRILITGTISKDYGVEIGLEWFKDLLAQYPNAQLKILGHKTSDFRTFDHPQVIYELNAEPIPHQKILKEMTQSDVIFMPYLWSKSFNGCVPAKLYECLYLGKTVFISKSMHLAEFDKYNEIYLIDGILPIINSGILRENTQRKEFHFKNLYPELDKVYSSVIR